MHCGSLRKCYSQANCIQLVYVFGFQAKLGVIPGLDGPAIQRRAFDVVAAVTPYLDDPLACNYTDFRVGDVTVRKHEPPNKRKGELMRSLIYYHGGGFTVGSIGKFYSFPQTHFILDIAVSNAEKHTCICTCSLFAFIHLSALNHANPSRC